MQNLLSQGSLFGIILKFVLYPALFFLPLVNFGGVYEGVKVQGLWIIGSLSAILLAYILIKKHELLIQALTDRDAFFVFWIALAVVSSIFGVHPLESLVGGSYRHQGVLFFLSLYFVSLLVRVHQIQRTRNDIPMVLIFSVFVQCAIVLVQTVCNIGRINGRTMGTFGEPNAVGGFISVGLWFYLWKAQDNKVHTFLKGAGIIIIMSALVTTGSRAGLAVSFYFLFLFFCMRLKKVCTAIQLIGLWFLFFVIGGFAFLVYTTKSELLVENRTVLWTLGLSGVLERPFLGYGLESGAALYDRLFQTYTPITLVNFMVDRSHNVLLDIAQWTGLVGLGVFLAWIYAVLKQWIERKEYVRTAGLLGWFLFALFQPVGVVQWLLFFLLIFCRI